MKEQKLKDNILQVKEYIIEMPTRRKAVAAVIAVAVVLFAIIITMAMNANQSKYRVLYQNIESAEATQVYQALKELGAEAQLNSGGEVMVLADEYDLWLLQLAEKGFPKTALSYDVFSSHSTMTTTESERQQWLIYQLQDRIQETLKRVKGVSNAVVTITLPENSDYIWEQATNKERGSASVLLTLQPGTTLEPGQVTAIKNLIAAGVPQMEPGDVTTVDAQTSLELVGENESKGISTTQNLKFEQSVQSQIEENIVRLLTPRYGEKGVVAVAKVTINYDKMIRETMQLQENPDGGGGYPTHTDGEYTLNGSETMGGIVGETNNTDIPTYGYNAAGGGQEETYYSWNTDIDYSYIKTQIEKGNAALERATVSVMVAEPNLTQLQQEELINLISRSVDIEPDLIFVSSFTAETPVVTPPVAPPETEIQQLFGIPLWIFFAVGGGLMLLIMLAIILILRRRKMKLLLKEEEIFVQNEEEMLSMEDEILAYKKQLADAANPDAAAKDEAIMDEVRDFAKSNPEITASLLRTWLREDD